MSLEVLDPSHENDARAFAPAKRLKTLKGATLGIISNGKKGTKPFFDALERELVDRYGVRRVVRLTKSNYSAPVEPELLNEAERWQALIAGVGD
ncbi:MAG: hypothetical protein LJE90_03445 [Betaproteobacteria bacterium]|jgi:hypothetical protein|nr:hypothetical protein [Betaproteobacteria bacterium]